jgi:hypothetical protein
MSLCEAIHVLMYAALPLQSSRTSTRNRLAAAMGWTSLLQPFRALAGGSSSGRSGRDSTNQSQRRYLQVRVMFHTALLHHYQCTL